jgi:hypothetical protein
MMLNPQQAKLTPITFTQLAAVAGVDDLGNSLGTSATITIDAIITPLQPSRLTDLAPLVGVDGGGIPVKVRVAAWPQGVTGNGAIATLTYNGQPATVKLAPLNGPSIPAQKVAPKLGVSAEGVLVYG